METEGFAEFIRHYLQNSETTAIDYPYVTQAFLDTLSDVDAGLIEQLADEVNAYYALDVDSASSSIRLKEEGGRDFRTPGEKLKDAGNEFYEAWIDSNRAIRLLDRENSTNTYKLATNAAYADNVALSILENALTDINGKYVSSSLLSRVKKIKASDKDVWRQFGEYQIVCDGPDRLKEGKRTFADDRKNSSKWMEFREKTIEHEHPEFKEAAKELYKFQHDFLWTWGVGTGLVSAESATDYEERHPKYVPFNRAIGKGHNGIKKQFANQSSTIHRAIGSGLDIVHPVDNIINNVTLMVKAGIYNNVMAEITKTAIRNEAMAFWLEKVQAPIKVTKYNAVELKEKLKQTVHEAGFKESDEDAVFGIIDNIDDILYQYGRGKAHRDVVTVLKNGKPEFWKINDAQLLASITNMSPKRLPAWLVAYGEVSRFMVSNITGNNVLWSIFSNFPRDIMTMWTFSADKNPLHILSGIGSAYLNKINPNKNDPLFREYLAMGGGHMSVYTADKSYTRNFRKKITGDKLQYLNPLELLEFVSDTVELGPRFSYYKIMRNRGLSPTEAFYEASDITTNFRRGGQMSQTINNVIPFFNASVQGLDKFARWTTAEEAPVGERKKAVKGRMLAFLLASLGLAGLMYGINHKTKKDGDNYAQLSNYTKNSYWCLPLGDGKYFTIPKPREIAVLSSLFEANMERYIAGDIHALDEFYQYATNTMLPNAVSNLAQGDFAGAIGSLGIIGLGAYMMSNRDFLGNPIVSSGLQSLEPKSQYTDRTSKLAYWIGQAFGTSPQMVDYFFQNTLGGWWKAQKALFPVGSENTDLTLGIQGQYVRDNQYSTDIVNRLYDAGTEAAEKSKSNPADSNASVKAKWYSTMTTFYSRYYALAKDKDDTTAHRAARQTVLNMISQFEKQMDSGSQTTEQKTVENISNQAGTTDYMPGVMQSAIKDDNGTSYTLSDTQYIDYQTNYLTNYYNSVEAALNAGNKDVKTQTDILKAAKDNARTNATAKALSSLGVTTKDFTQSQSAAKVGLTDSDMILYQAALDMANDDGSLKQEEVISILKSMDLTDNERSFLFLQKYKAKNNPFD